MIDPICCSYCGHKPYINYDGIQYIVQCPRYTCNNPFCAIADTEEGAISMWNEMSMQTKGDK